MISHFTCCMPKLMLSNRVRVDPFHTEIVVGAVGRREREAFSAFHRSGDPCGPLVECTDDELVETDPPQIDVDRLKRHGVSTKGL